MKRLLLPILKKYWKPLLATMLIAAIGCTYTVGLSGGYLSLERSMYEYLDSYGYPDAVITTEMTDRSRIAALEAVPGVETVNARVWANTVLQSAEGRYLSVRCFSFSDGDRSRLYTWSSADGDGADALYLDYKFAKSNGIRAGDTVRVKLDDGWREVLVGGVVSTPETITVQPTETDWTLSGDFGYAYFSVRLLEEEYDRRTGEARSAIDEKSGELATARRELEETSALLPTAERDRALAELAAREAELQAQRSRLDGEPGYAERCNQFLLWFDTGADPEQTLAAAEAALGGVEVVGSFTFEESPVKTRIDENLSPIRALSSFVPSAYYVILMVITFLFMSLIVRQCRREIGILRAIGKSVGSIRGLFCGVGLVVSLAANIVGIGLSVFFTWFVGRRNVQYFTLPVYMLRFDWAGVLKTCLLNILAGQLATAVGTGIITKISPAEAMSRPAPSTVRIPGFLSRLTRRMRPMTAFSITTIFRNPLRFIASTICVSATIMGILSSLAAVTSDDYFLYDVYERRIRYDCRIFYSDTVSDEAIAQLEALEITEDLQRAPIYLTDVAFGGNSEKTVVTAPDPETELLRVYDRAGDCLALSSLGDGILLEEHLAERLGAKIGDAVLVNGCRSMVVEGLSFQCTAWSQYIAPESAEALGEESVSSLICRVAPENEQTLLETLAEQDGYLYAVFSRRAYESAVDQQATYHFIAWIIILFTMVTGFLIVLNTARTNLLEKKKELCILRTLGFRHGEISKSWAVQSVVQYLCACAIGLPLGRVLAEATLRRLSTAHYEFVYVNSAREILITLVCVALYVVASHFAAMRDLKRWDIVENVKEKE